MFQQIVIKMKLRIFQYCFCLFSFILVLDFLLIIIESKIKFCERCAGEEGLILIPILMLFWLGIWVSGYVIIFFDSKKYSDKFFILKWYRNKLVTRYNGITLGLVFFRIVYLSVIIFFSFIVLFGFIKLLTTVFLLS